MPLIPITNLRADRASHIQIGDVLLIDLWAKLTQPDAVYYDITWTGFCGEVIPDAVHNVFEVVRDARKCGSQFVIDRIAQMNHRRFRSRRRRSGPYRKNYGQYFFHRTGHSIGTSVHGTGANMDNLESHDERRIIPGSCFSIEPGSLFARIWHPVGGQCLCWRRLCQCDRRRAGTNDPPMRRWVLSDLQPN